MGEKLILDEIEFGEIVGQLRMDELVKLGVTDCLILGSFLPNQIYRVQSICSQHPELHIISHEDNVTYNRYVEDAASYSIGSGNRDTDLTFRIGTSTRGDVTKELERFLAIPKDERDFADKFVIRHCAELLASIEPSTPKLYQRRVGAFGQNRR